jgi:hypothetical protein
MKVESIEGMTIRIIRKIANFKELKKLYTNFLFIKSRLLIDTVSAVVHKISGDRGQSGLKDHSTTIVY